MPPPTQPERIEAAKLGVGLETIAGDDRSSSEHEDFSEDETGEESFSEYS